HYDPPKSAEGDAGNVSNTGTQTGPVERTGIGGRVVASDTGKPIEGIAVDARAVDDPQRRVPLLGVVTNEEGRYFWPLRPGMWKLVIAAEGYRPAARQTDVREGAVALLDFELSP